MPSRRTFQREIARLINEIHGKARLLDRLGAYGGPKLVVLRWTPGSRPGEVACSDRNDRLAVRDPIVDGPRVASRREPS